MEQTNTTFDSITNLVGLIRHGERADHVEVVDESLNYDNKPDPPLTKKGWLQAAKTGEYLRDVLAKSNYDDVVFECSPFIRCI